jgi:spermidine/putrescine-binding protein
MSLTKENQAKAEEILSEAIMFNGAQTHLGKVVPFEKAIVAMGAYATHREQQAVKKALEYITTMADNQQIQRPMCDEDSYYNYGLIDLIERLGKCEPAILSLLKGGEE